MSGIIPCDKVENFLSSFPAGRRGTREKSVVIALGEKEDNMKPISEIVSGRPLFSVTKENTVAEVAQFMAEKNVGAIPVMEDNRLVGIFSERDVITRVVSKGLNPAEVKVGDVMTTKIVVANAEESYDSCLKKMQQAHCRHLPVISGERLIGFVSLRDLLMMDLNEKERNLEYLQSYIYTVPPGTAKRYESQS